jgi:hypothetical protein
MPYQTDSRQRSMPGRKAPTCGEGGRGGLEVRLWALEGPYKPQRGSRGDDGTGERNGARGNPEREAATWLERISEVERQRSRAQDLAIEGLLTPEELRDRLRHLEEVCRSAEEKLAALRECEERLQALEHDRDALLKSYAKLVPEALDTLEAEERHRVYKMLRLSTLAYPDGTLEVSGAIGEDVTVCINDSAS